MLHFFIEPYPDESFYSIILRYHKYVANDNIGQTLFELFGNYFTPIFFPNGLNYLHKKLRYQDTYTPEKLIEQYTLFPFFQPFLFEETKDLFMQYMKKSEGYKIHSKLNNDNGFSFRMTSIKFCESCIEADKKLYGEPYLHRTHQIPGNFICNLHQEVLNEHKIKNEKFDRELPYFNIIFQSHEKVIQCEKIPNDIFRVSYDVQLIMDGILKDYNLNMFRKKYITKVEQSGHKIFYSYQTFFLKEIFRETFSYDFLRLIEPNFYENRPIRWLKNLFFKRTVHPIHPIMLIYLLFGDIENFKNFSVG